MKRNMEETFGYDRMDRLIAVSFNAAPSGSASYDGLGCMTAKTAGGQPVFSSAVYGLQGRPHAVNQASVAGNPFPTVGQTVDYNAFDKVSVVRQGGDSLRYTYGFDRRRTRLEEWRGSLRREKLYVGSCERVTEALGGAADTRWWTFLTGPGGVYAVVVTEGVSHSVHYILRDHLGSWTMVTDCDGAVEQELSYDAWGNLRNPGTWVNYGIAESGGSEPMFDRGFTGHEHLSRFGLVNMDGRMYDPFTASFLSADRFVQDPSSAQGFNRYAYCMHNPLRYVDPTGWFMGPPRSKTDMIQEYLSDPCPITRQDLLEAGMYDIEGGYGWYGGEGSMSAGWMESDGSVHTSQWDVTTSGGGFDAGAWAISASFHPMWMNECRGLLCYEYRNPVNTNSFNSVNTNLNVGGGHGGGNGGGLRSQNCPMIKNTNTLLGYVVPTESTLFGARAHGLDKLKNSKALDELGKSLRASYESRRLYQKG